jgi:hypothetical protein
MSFAARSARRRGVIFRPPEPGERAWHNIETHMGPMTLEWRPGIEIWRDVAGQRWTAELAGELEWRYVGPVP